MPDRRLTADYEVCFMAETSPLGALCVCQTTKINVAVGLVLVVLVVGRHCGTDWD